MRTYGLLVNPLTLGTVRLLSNVLWPVRKLLCLLLGHEPQASMARPDDWSIYCWRCGQAEGRER